MGSPISRTFGFFRKKVLLHGEIVSYQFIIEVAEEGQALEYLQSNRTQIENEIQEQVDLYLGKGVKIQDLRIRRGTIEIIVILGTAYAIYLGFSRYKNFIESAQLLKSQIGRIFRRWVERYGVRSVHDNVILSPDLPDVGMRTDSDKTLTMILLGYLLLSHAALLAFFIWIAVKKLGG